MLPKLSELIALLQDIRDDLPPGMDPHVIIWDQWDQEGALRQYDTVTHNTGLVQFELVREAIVARTPHQAAEIVHNLEATPD